MTASAGSQKHQERGARARRYNHALVALARRVWSEDCTLDSAIALLCQVAADTLEVERVNVWRADPRDNTLRCIHGYVRGSDQHNPAGYDEVLLLDSEYGAQLDDVRVIDIVDASTDSTVTESSDSLQAYLKRHDIHSLLDAPIRSQGELLGVV